MNPVTGEKAVRIHGVDYIVRFTWKVLSEISARYGDSPNLFDPGIVADVAAKGMRERHPEMTAEKIMDLSPPLIPFSHEIQTALKWAYFGPEALPQTSDDVKKNRRRDGFWRHIKRLLRRASDLMISGT